MDVIIQAAGNELEKLLDKMLGDINTHKWDDVVQANKDHPGTHSAGITTSGDTALHVAVYNRQESVVASLVGTIQATSGRAGFEKKNAVGNTPLHLAAYVGSARICHCIAEVDSKLIEIKNDDEETPLFLAVRHGRKEAYAALHSFCPSLNGGDYLKGKGGNTILHSAIAGEYFELAWDIMNDYPSLMKVVNDDGLLPLHILADKPSAFESGSRVVGFRKLIYQCIFVDQLEVKTGPTRAPNLEYKEGAKYPRNYHTYVGMFTFLWHVLMVLLGYSNQKNDEESNRNEKHEEEKTTKDDQQSKQHSELIKVLCGPRDANTERLQSGPAQPCTFFPANYVTILNFLKLISTPVLLLLGIGFKSVEKMRKKKRKNVWSFQIMMRLLEDASGYEYKDNGKSRGSEPEKEDKKKDNGKSPGSEPSKEEDKKKDNDKSPGSEPGKEEDKKKDNGKSPGSEPGKEEDKKKDNGKTEKEKDKKKDESGKEKDKKKNKETPILIAAKNGVLEMVKEILKRSQTTALDVNDEEKNIALLAVEHRQPHVYKFLTEWDTPMKETILRKTDKDGNSAKHLAARIGNHRPWLIPVLQMQWEIKWYEFVKDSMPPRFFPKRNHKSETPREIFTETHENLVKESGKWLANTSESCSVVAALIVTLAYPTFATIPGGVKSDDSGIPSLQTRPVFSVFAISALIAFSFVIFMAQILIRIRRFIPILIRIRRFSPILILSPVPHRRSNDIHH